MALVELARFDNRIEAELARLNLGAEGIEAVLFDAEMNSFGWGPLMPIRLMVTSAPARGRYQRDTRSCRQVP